MRKVIFLFILSIAIFSCEKKDTAVIKAALNPSDTSQINKKIREYILKVANDPSSYQPVETILFDSVSQSEYYKYILGVCEGAYSSCNALLKTQLETALLLKEKPDTSETMVNLRKYLAEMNSCQDSINNSKRANATREYKYTHKCRLKNKMGALVLFEYVVITDDSLNVISLKD